MQKAVESGAAVGKEYAGVGENEGEGIIGAVDGVVEGDEAAPLVANEDDVAEVEFPDEGFQVVAVEIEGVEGSVVGCIRLAEADGVGGEAAPSGGDEVGEEVAVGVGGGTAAVEHDDGEGGFRAGVVVVHAEAVDDEESVGVWEVVVGHGGLVWVSASDRYVGLMVPHDLG